MLIFGGLIFEGKIGLVSNGLLFGGLRFGRRLFSGFYGLLLVLSKSKGFCDMKEDISSFIHLFFWAKVYRAKFLSSDIFSPNKKFVTFNRRNISPNQSKGVI